MIKIVIVSHNDLADSFLKTAEMICGKQQDILCFGLKPNQSHDELYQELKNAYPEEDEVLFLVDMFGGTPYNEALRIVEGNYNDSLLTGLNLGLLIEALLSRGQFEKSKELAAYLLSKAEESISINSPESKEQKIKKMVEPTNKNQPMEYVLCRIDSRLLHGQIATGWKNEVKPNRIIVVSNKVSHDNLRKKMIVKSCPSDCKANVVPVKKMAEVDKDARFNGVRALLLFEEPEDVLEAVKAGVRIQHVNIGSISQKEDRMNVGSAVSLNQKDVEVFRELANLGITFDVRKVPSDADEGLEQMLKKVEAKN